jgi:hypothetical protein
MCQARSTVRLVNVILQVPIDGETLERFIEQCLGKIYAKDVLVQPCLATIPDVGTK